jgi:hypothetical protein
MGTGFRRAKYIGNNSDTESRRAGHAKRDVLEGDWDELVIRFDKESRQFRVRTAKQTGNRKTAKLRPGSRANSEK